MSKLRGDENQFEAYVSWSSTAGENGQAGNVKSSFSQVNLAGLAANESVFRSVA